MSAKKYTLTFALLIAMAATSIAQPSLQKMQQKLTAKKQNTNTSYYKFELSSKMQTQAGVLFSPDRAVPKGNLQSWLVDKLALRPDVDALLETGNVSEYAGTEISKLQQYYRGVKVEHGVISKVVKQDKVLLLQMEFYPVPDNLPAKSTITEADALQKALDYTNAKKYVWDGYTGKELRYQKPAGELVIVEDMFNNEGTLCLAYKFDIYSTEPIGRKLVYVNAITGKVAFTDELMKHAVHNSKPVSNEINAANQADENGTNVSIPVKKNNGNPLQAITGTKVQGGGYSRYSGALNMFTTLDVATNKYSLLAEQMGDNTTVETLDLQNRVDITTAVPFLDDDNFWNELSTLPGNEPIKNLAIDAHWATQKAVSYWWEKHQRKSYDNNNGKVNCYIHYSSGYDNAQWNGSEILCGDGKDGVHPFVTTDFLSHEFGHAICQYTAGFVYKRESGALNEGFSDIWAACFDNYIALGKDIWKIGEEIYPNATPLGFRSMAFPYLYNDPDTYLTDPKWKNATLEGCPVPNKDNYPIAPATGDGNDNCGVHYNSSVLNKWFYLITNGGALSNWNQYNYSVSPMGFDKTEKLAFFTEQILTPNSGFEAAKIASLNAAKILMYDADIPNINEAWKAVGVYSDSIYNTTNTPVFGANNDFKSIGVGKYGHVWAGTANNGLFKYNGVNWVKATNLTNNNIADIKPDAEGRIWIAQYGRTGSQALGGGIVSYFDTSFASYNIYNSSSDGVNTLNMRSLFVNNDISVDTFKRVWVAGMATTGTTTFNGGVYNGNKNETILDFSYDPFKEIKTGVNQTVGGLCQTIGGNKDEIWVFAANNNTANSYNQILRYATADRTFLGYFDNTNTTLLPSNFTAKAIYYDTVGKKWWIGMLSGGVYLYDGSSATPTWTQINFPSIFPAGTVVNNNAITGDSVGNIYMGTSNGLVVFGNTDFAGGSLDATQENAYRRFTTATGLPSNNVRAIAVDERSSRLLLATDNGIVFKYNRCWECINADPIYSISIGAWDDPTIWSTGKVPGPNSIVVVRNGVVVTKNATCRSLKVIGTNANVFVDTGVTLKILGEKIPGQ